MGFGLSAVALDPGAASRVTRSGRADLAVAAAAALLLAGTSLLIALFTLADVLGVGLRELRTPGLVSTYIWDVEVSRAHLIAAGLAVVGLRSASGGCGPWGVRPAWLAVAGVAVGLPCLTGHSAGLGGHSLALISGFLHAIAATVWAGGVVALATHAVRRSPEPEGTGPALRCRGDHVGRRAGPDGLRRRRRPGWSPCSQLVSTPYGRMVLVKVAALVVAGLLGLAMRRSWRSVGGRCRPAGWGGCWGSWLRWGPPWASPSSWRAPRSRASRSPCPPSGEDLIGYAYPPAPTVRAASRWGGTRTGSG